MDGALSKCDGVCAAVDGRGGIRRFWARVSGVVRRSNRVGILNDGNVIGCKEKPTDEEEEHKGDMKDAAEKLKQIVMADSLENPCHAKIEKPKRSLIRRVCGWCGRGRKIEKKSFTEAEKEENSIENDENINAKDAEKTESKQEESNDLVPDVPHQAEDVHAVPIQNIGNQELDVEPLEEEAKNTKPKSLEEFGLSSNDVLRKITARQAQLKAQIERCARKYKLDEEQEQLKLNPELWEQTARRMHRKRRSRREGEELFPQQPVATTIEEIRIFLNKLDSVKEAVTALLEFI